MREPICTTEKIILKTVNCPSFSPGSTIIIVPLDAQQASCEFCIESFVIGGAKVNFAFKVFGNITNYENIHSDFATIIVNRNGSIHLEIIS